MVQLPLWPCARRLAPAALSAQVSLRTVVEMAQQNSSAVRLAEADVQKAQAALAQTQDAYIPNFVIGSQIGYSHGFPTGQPSVGSATMQSLVLSFSQRQYIKAARAGVEAANLNLKDANEQVALDASTAYIELDTVNRELAAARQQESFAAELVRIEQQRAEAGVDSNLDLLQARLKAAQIKLQTPATLKPAPPRWPSSFPSSPACPSASILPDHASIPEIPAVTADRRAAHSPRHRIRGRAGALQADSKPTETTWPGVVRRSASEPSTTTTPTS